MLHCLQARDMVSWPGLMPLYLSTLLQLGLLRNRGIPGLVVSDLKVLCNMLQRTVMTMHVLGIS
jgi:hypothetical protein